MHTIDEIKSTKLWIAIQTMLIDFLKLKVGDRIKTIDEYTISNNFSKGTYFNALSIIGQNDLVSLEKKGHVGTLIKEIDYAKIIVFLGKEHISLAMPYPKTLVLKQTASAFNKTILPSGIDFYILFSRGSRNRANLLVAGVVDLILISKLSLKILLDYGVKLKAVYELDQTVHNENVHIYIRKGEKELINQNRKLKILYDNNSYDIKSIANALFGDKTAEFVFYAYTQSLELLRDKQVDIIIHGEIEHEEVERYGVEVYYSENPDQAQMLKDSSSVCVVIRQDDIILEKLINLYVSKELIESNIKDIIQGKKGVEF